LNAWLAVALFAAGLVSLNAQSRVDLLRLLGQTVSGTVVSVADGDTVRLRLDSSGKTIRVRLEGIDAPEQGEPFSTQARNATRVLLFNRKVSLKASDVDKYDRLVARVFVDSKDSSLQLVESGLACHFTRFANDPSLAKAQVTARTAGRGFWAAGAQKPACVKFTNAK
jgi:endonuclease YncB( thermonuclease family)